MADLDSEIAKLTQQIDECERMLRKPIAQWSDYEKEAYGNKDQLRDEKKLLLEKEKLLLEKEVHQSSSSIPTGIHNLLAYTDINNIL